MKTLGQLAHDINNKFAGVKANYIELGKLLIAARARVKKETKFTWREWCKVNLRKQDGKPFSAKTLENYMYLARDPRRVDKQQDMQRKNIRRIRNKAKGIETADAVATLFTKNASVSAMLNILMTAWEYSNAEAQHQFLEIIGARL